MTGLLDRLIGQLARLPGIGKKSATRLAYYLVGTDEGFARSLAATIAELRDRIHPCARCGLLTEHGICEICADDRRDRSVICVVEQSQDVVVLESTREFHGLYHVLGGVLSPIDGVGPENLSIATLVQRVRELSVQEVVMATNPTLEGDATALYIGRLLAQDPVRVTRPALGLPVGGDLEYADSRTLARSLRARAPFTEDRS